MKRVGVSGVPSPAEVGSRAVLGRYELLHRLGHGGMATVYLARLLGTAGFEKLVAIKVIHEHLANEAEFVDMFLDEARIVARLHAPNVVEILDLGQDDGRYFIVMEYVEGEALSSLIRWLRLENRRLPLAVVLQIAVDVCTGLVAAHALLDREGRPYGLVHRDLSPHNLLVGLDGWVKIVDFGIMKAAGKRSVTLSGQLRGKVAYMSPEQAKGGALDARSDVFALGSVIYELCTSRRLFEGATDATTLRAVVDCDHPPLDAVHGEIPAGLVRVLGRALAVDPADRYPSALAMLKDLRLLLRQAVAEGPSEGAARALEGEARRDDEGFEPREVLAHLMTEHFGARAAYLQALLRGQGGLGPGVALDRDAAAAADSSSGGLAVPRGALEGVVKTVALRGEIRGASDDRALFAAKGEARTLVSWRAWTGGAVVLVSVAGLSAIALAPRAPVDAGSAAQRPAPHLASPPPTVGPGAVDPGIAALRPSEPRTVKWLFNSEPPGARVLLDGIERGVTPLEVQVPRGDQTIDVMVHRPGYEAIQLKLAPLESQNHRYRLVVDAAAETLRGPESFDRRTKLARKPGLPRNDAKAQVPAEPSAALGSSGTGGSTEATDRGPKPMPDFVRLVSEPRHSLPLPAKP